MGSTFLAIITLSPSKSYVFIVFFRAWFGIIIFGMANGFILLPVMLSFVGPTEDVGHVLEEELKDLPGKKTLNLAIKESTKAKDDGNDTSRDKEDRVKKKALEKDTNQGQTDKKLRMSSRHSLDEDDIDIPSEHSSEQDKSRTIAVKTKSKTRKDKSAAEIQK